MLSALSHSSLANSPSPDLRPPTKKNVKTEPEQENDNNPNEGQNDHDHEGSGYEDNMDYNVDEIPVHPLAPAPSSYSSSSFSQGPYPGPQQHQQLLKLKTEHGVSSFTSSTTPDITMSGEDQDEASNMENQPSTEDAHYQISGGAKANLMVDTTRSDHSLSRRDSMLTPMTGTPSSDTPSSAAPSSGRRPSLRTMTTLPRSALQEETIALFKQYRDLIPCAKCFSRKTIQRDGMSDGNLRFKCRPPVSMNLICNKSYSESKIRNMIAGVVYGNSLPESGTPTSGGPGSDNVLAMAPPPTGKGSRRSSHVDGSPSVGPEMTPDLDGRERDQLDDYSEMDRDDMSPGAEQTMDDGSQRSISRRPSIQQIRRGSMAGEESMSMDYDPSASHPNYLQVPGTPPMDNNDPRLHRPRSAHGDNPRSVTPTGLSHVTSPVPPRSNKTLRHSHSHPNIGQQRQHPQHPTDPQDRLKEHRGSLGNIAYPTATQSHHHHQRQLQRQILRRESTQPHGVRHRPEPERRSSHPVILPSSSTSKYLPIGSIHEAHSPILSSSSPRASPGRETLGQDHRAGDYHRRMSQPHHSYGSLPPPHPSPLSNHYDRRAIEEEYHREKYDKMNSHLQPGARYPVKSPRLSHTLPDGEEDARAMAPMRSHGSHWMPGEGHNYAAQAEPMRYSHSLPLGSSHRPQLRQQASSSSLYYSQPRRDEPESPQSEGRDLSPDYGDDDRPRLGVKRKSLGNSISRTSSNQNLYATATTTAMTTTNSPRDLSSALPKSSIKLTCFPGTGAPTATPSSKTLHSTDALAMQLHQSSKLVIEISQPMLSQAYPPASQSLVRSSSQPNLLMRPSSVLGRRRSVSPADYTQDYGLSKKRRAESLVGKEGDEDQHQQQQEASEPSATEAAAAAVVAAAAAASGSTVAPEKKMSSLGGLQIIGVDYINKSSGNKGLGLVDSTTTPTYVLSGSDTTSPSIEALGVARASSYAPIEDQKELGIDYSLFTRVETAGWRILIPPNVTASFQSDDFGLVLKPKGPVQDVASGVVAEEEEEEEGEDVQGGSSSSRRSSDGGQSVEDQASDEIKKSFSNIALDDQKESQQKEDMVMATNEKDVQVVKGGSLDEKIQEAEKDGASAQENMEHASGEDVDMDELEDE
ncbi:hypothetical protein BGZ74_001787 [Mortierella antarctica]|nr:hypothetical protein BGZ74_001787 [Mortierella antarctica]